MKLQLISEKFFYDGLIEIEIDIINKKAKTYKYTLNSKRVHEDFRRHYDFNRHGRALATLKANKI